MTSNSDIVNKVVDFYASWGDMNPEGLSEIYHPDVIFVDPVHRIEGLQQLSEYFVRSMAGVQRCEFTFKSVVEQDASACLAWTMDFSHPKLAQGKSICLSGMSHILFDETVYFHRDYYDTSEMLFEHIPLVGGFHRYIKKRLAGESNDKSLSFFLAPNAE